MDKLVLADVTALMPENWQSLLCEIVEARCKPVVQFGRGPGSLEPEATAGLDYKVADGRNLAGINWLEALYSQVAFVLSHHWGKVIMERQDVAGRININVLVPGKRYELHTDQNSHTAIIFADTFELHEGGELDVQDVAMFHPVAGQMVAFPGSVMPHRVLPTQRQRVTIVLSYMEYGLTDKPANSYLYS